MLRCAMIIMAAMQVRIPLCNAATPSQPVTRNRSALAVSAPPRLSAPPPAPPTRMRQQCCRGNIACQPLPRHEFVPMNQKAASLAASYGRLADRIMRQIENPAQEKATRGRNGGNHAVNPGINSEAYNHVTSAARSFADANGNSRIASEISADTRRNVSSRQQRNGIVAVLRGRVSGCRLLQPAVAEGDNRHRAASIKRSSQPATMVYVTQRPANTFAVKRHVMRPHRMLCWRCRLCFTSC